jgi:hypothetical protein
MGEFGNGIAMAIEALQDSSFVFPIFVSIFL